MATNEGSQKDNSSGIHSVDEIDYFGFLENAKASADEIVLQTVKCNNCNASTTVDVDSSDSSCPYCGDKLVTGDLKPESVIKPWGLIPFRFNQQEAVNIYQKWIKKRWFAPSSFSRQPKFQSIYLPYWTFDTYANVQFIGQRGDEYYDGERNYMLWTDVVDEVPWYFDDILICASESVKEESINDLRPWGTEDIIPFEDKYLKGFISEKYGVDLKEGFQKAQERTTEGIEALLREYIGGDDQKILKARTSYTDITFKHILLPVHIVSHEFRGKRYQVLVNGKTGKVQGKSPKSLDKILAAVFGTIMLIAVIIRLFF